MGDDVSLETKKRRQARVSLDRAEEAIDRRSYADLERAAENLLARAQELQEVSEADG